MNPLLVIGALAGLGYVSGKTVNDVGNGIDAASNGVVKTVAVGVAAFIALKAMKVIK